MEVFMEDSKYSHYEQEDERIDISALIDGMWKGFLRFWWIILAVVSICSSFTCLYMKRHYEPRYSAYSTFTVRASASYGYNENRYNTLATVQLGRVFPYLLTNNVLRELVAADLGTNGIPGTITASALEDTNLITLTVTARDPQMAYDILQSVIRNYPRISSYVIGDITLNPLDQSGMPDRVINPFNLRRSAAYGTLGGLAVCILFLAFYTMTRTTVVVEDDLRKLFSISCLGAIPLVRIKKRSKSKRKPRDQLIIMDSPVVPHYFIESLRTIRTHLEKECGEDDIHTILVTSAIPGEGKTTVAINTAMALVNKEKKVALLDCDLRSPAVARNMGLYPQESGMIDIIEGRRTFAEVAIPYKDNPDFMVVPGGESINNTSEALNGDNIKELIRDLKEQFDYVIIDTPPSAVVSDASWMARYVDGGIFVVRQDYAKVELLQEGMEMHAGTGIRMLGTILNNTVSGITGYGYGYGNYGYGKSSYGYGSRYGYTYGYGSAAEEETQAEEADETEGKQSV